ncbi:MAG: hypothetical protein ACLTY5_00475 [Angelakisella sp.]
MAQAGYDHDGDCNSKGVKDILVRQNHLWRVTIRVLFDDGSYNSYNVLEMGGPYQPDQYRK